MSKKFAKNVSLGERTLSVAFGVYLLYQSLKDIRSRPVSAFAAVYLLFRGGVGYCPLNRQIGKKDTRNPAINIKAHMTVNKSRSTVYRYWRKLRNLPFFMSHLLSVEESDEIHSHWIAKMPGTVGTIEWDAEIVKDEPDYLIGWQSVSGSPLTNAGKVQLYDTADGLGTEVRVVFSYHPPAGGLGTGIAKLFNPFFKRVIEAEIHNFKNIMEANPEEISNER